MSRYASKKIIEADLEELVNGLLNRLQEVSNKGGVDIAELRGEDVVAHSLAGIAVGDPPQVAYMPVKFTMTFGRFWGEGELREVILHEKWCSHERVDEIMEDVARKGVEMMKELKKKQVEETKKREITEEMVEYVRDRMPSQVIAFFKKLQEHHSGPTSVVSEFEAEHYYRGEDTPYSPPLPIPHPTHFREGMTVRNMLRQSGLCEGWTDHELDDNWAKVVTRILERG